MCDVSCGKGLSVLTKSRVVLVQEMEARSEQEDTATAAVSSCADQAQEKQVSDDTTGQRTSDTDAAVSDSTSAAAADVHVTAPSHAANSESAPKTNEEHQPIDVRKIRLFTKGARCVFLSVYLCCSPLFYLRIFFYIGLYFFL